MVRTGLVFAQTENDGSPENCSNRSKSGKNSTSDSRRTVNSCRRSECRTYNQRDTINSSLKAAIRVGKYHIHEKRDLILNID